MKKSKQIKILQNQVEDLEKLLTDTGNKLYWAEENSNRFLAHLEAVAAYLNVEFIDGDFPLEEIKTAILEYRWHDLYSKMTVTKPLDSSDWATIPYAPSA
jgi:hypothetical protein